jgi:hypothetical protein
MAVWSATAVASYSLKIGFTETGNSSLTYGRLNLRTARIPIFSTTDLRTLCSGLENFNLPAALGALTEDTLVVANGPFRNRLGLTDEELSGVRLSYLLRLDESYSGILMAGDDAQHLVRFVPCALKSLAGDEVMPGVALRRSDGMILLMLRPKADDALFQEFIHGRLIGRSEERNRTRKFFHDLLSSKILAASFLAHAAHDKLSSGGDGSGELAKVTALLNETIEAIAYGFDGKTVRIEEIPEQEAASARRLSMQAPSSSGELS